MDIGQMLLELSGPRSELPESCLAEQTVHHSIESALATLSPPLREAIVLRYGHGLRYREIADVMNCPQKTAESRVRLAHEALRGLLHADGPSLLAELMDNT
jgi:RNA polymerase sigma-70 factor (ECF subfamily)